MAESSLSPKEEMAASVTSDAHHFDTVYSWLTVERALYLGLGLLALMLRLYGLGRRPMQPQEARQALAAWQLLQGQSAETGGCSPLILTANFALFALLGANDVSARLLPALLGTLLVLLPYGLRRWLGREGALLVAALLALSPLALFNARYLSGTTAVATSALLLLIGLAHWVEDRRPGTIHLAAGGLAGLLLAGPGAYTVLLILASFGLLLGLTNRRLRLDELVRSPQSIVRGLKSAVRSQIADLGLRTEDWGLSLALIMGLIATAFLLNPSGLQALLDLLPAWGRGFMTVSDGLPWLQYLALLPLYDPLLLAFGLAGLVLAWRERDLLGLFLSYWALAALVLTSLMTGRGAGDALLVALPLALLAGRFLGQHLPEWVGGATWGQEGFFVALACGLVVYAGLQLSFFSLSGDAAYLQIIGVVMLLIVGLFASIGRWLGREAACRGVGLFLLLILGLVTLSTGINLNFVHLGDPHELALAAPISLQVRTLLSDVARLSAQWAIDERAVEVALHRDLALPLAWYLRDYPNLKVVESLAPTVDSTAVIAPVAEDNPSLGGPYGGQDYLLRSWWVPATLRGADWGKWLLRRQASTPPQEERVILWVRQEES